MDVEIGEENGIDIGKKIREIHSDCKIIITSSYKKYLIEGYKIRAERYFIKPILEKEFFIEMEDVLNHYFYKEYGFVDEKISKRKILVKDILYIEYLDKHTLLHCTNEIVYKAPHPLKYWVDTLSKYDFCQCYKCFVVNLLYVEKMEKNDIVLINGEKIPVSRFYKKGFENAYVERLSRRAC